MRYFYKTWQKFPEFLVLKKESTNEIEESILYFGKSMSGSENASLEKIRSWINEMWSYDEEIVVLANSDDNKIDNLA